MTVKTIHKRLSPPNATLINSFMHHLAMGLKNQLRHGNKTVTHKDKW